MDPTVGPAAAVGLDGVVSGGERYHVRVQPIDEQAVSFVEHRRVVVADSRVFENVLCGGDRTG